MRNYCRVKLIEEAGLLGWISLGKPNLIYCLAWKILGHSKQEDLTKITKTYFNHHFLPIF